MSRPPERAERPESAENGARGRLPLWREEFSVHRAEEQYVSRRQFGKFLVLTSVGMLAGNVWIAIRAAMRRPASFPRREIAAAGSLAVGSSRVFFYPGEQDPCLLVRRGESDWVAYSQKCTHLSCAVFYARESDRLECPCHAGAFSLADGRVLQGPPPRPLPKIELERQGDRLFAVAVRLEPES